MNSDKIRTTDPPWAKETIIAQRSARLLPTREQIAKTISMAEERVLYPDGLPTDEEGPLECHYEAADDVLALLTRGNADA